jgi:predicted Zn-ribbon and HTH transcriptional regulator
MVISKNKVYEASSQLTFEYMLDQAKKALQAMGSKEITTQNLDKTFIRFVGKFPPNSPFGNQVTTAIYQEGQKYFVQLKADTPEAEQFWVKFESLISSKHNISGHGSGAGSNDENMLFEQAFQLVNGLCQYIRNMGGVIDEEFAWYFMINYQSEAQQFPSAKEIPEIAAEYLKLAGDSQSQAEMYGDANVDLSLAPEIVQVGAGAPEVQITAQDALRLMLEEITTLDPESIESYYKLMQTLELEDQQRVVTRLRQIEADLNKIPYLMNDERKQLREEVFELTTEKRRAKLLKLMKDRQKNELFYLERFSEQEIRQKLNSMKELTPVDVEDLMTVILSLTINDKKNMVNIINEIDEAFKKMATEGIKITIANRKAHRLDLIRMNEKDRLAEYDRIMEHYRAEFVKGILFKEIPALQYEKHESIVKELMWLNEEELKRRIKQIKSNIEKEKEEKTREFEKSTSATACKKCGWPMGSFSKKCPRCGSQVDDWFKLK